MIILDTNTISKLMRPKPSAQVATWVAQQPGTELFMTSISEAEISHVIELLGRGKRREGVMAAAGAMFSEDFARRVLVFDSDAARVFAKIGDARHGLGRPISPADARIAALAQARGAKLATRNVDDFEDCGIAVVDP
jgi:predicted nucleic acid-binding protein